MQLIIGSESAIEINEKMTTVGESLEKSLSDDISTLKKDVANGNKENIQCPDNIINNSEEVISSNNDKEIVASVISGDKTNTKLDEMTNDIEDITKNVEEMSSSPANESSNEENLHGLKLNANNDMEVTHEDIGDKKKAEEASINEKTIPNNIEGFSKDVEGNAAEGLVMNAETLFNNIDDVIKNVDEETEAEETVVNEKTLSNNIEKLIKNVADENGGEEASIDEESDTNKMETETMSQYVEDLTEDIVKENKKLVSDNVDLLDNQIDMVVDETLVDTHKQTNLDAVGVKDAIKCNNEYETAIFNEEIMTSQATENKSNDGISDIMQPSEVIYNGCVENRVEELKYTVKNNSTSVKESNISSEIALSAVASESMLVDITDTEVNETQNLVAINSKNEIDKTCSSKDLSDKKSNSCAEVMLETNTSDQKCVASSEDSEEMSMRKDISNDSSKDKMLPIILINREDNACTEGIVNLNTSEIVSNRSLDIPESEISTTNDNMALKEKPDENDVSQSVSVEEATSLKDESTVCPKTSAVIEDITAVQTVESGSEHITDRLKPLIEQTKDNEVLTDLECIGEVEKQYDNIDIKNSQAMHNKPSENHITTEVKNDTLINPIECDSISHIEEQDTSARKLRAVNNINEVDSALDKTNIESKKESKNRICKLSNTLDILSDDDEELPQAASEESNMDKPCIKIDDDDDIMLIDEDNNSKNEAVPIKESVLKKTEDQIINHSSNITIDLENNSSTNVTNDDEKIYNKVMEVFAKETSDPEVKSEKLILNKVKETYDTNEPILAENPLKAGRTIRDDKPPLAERPLLDATILRSLSNKNLSEMTRSELEEFCTMKIVESVIDRSSLSELKTRLKLITQNIEEYKKKALSLCKQNRDLQVVLKSIQKEQKKNSETIVPLKITRSVGMQVLMTEKPSVKKKSLPPANNNVNKNTRTPNQSPRPRQPVPSTSNSGPTQVPVPRLVLANNPAAKTASTVPQSTAINSQAKTTSPVQNGVKNTQPAQKAEKRPRSQSVTVDLTDDEPPSKITPKNSPVPPVRLVSPQNLLSSQRPSFGQAINSPRKVYIPISGPQGQNIRPGQIMLKTLQTGPRQRCPPPHLTRMPSHNQMRMPRVHNRHPAPLPDAMKQYQPPNWKALPPAPDLKLSKVENGIVISWKIEGYQEDSYEEIASYQLYAYQETSSPPNTALWKKIGDVKALPLPMACTLTQFMAGFKYYFAVRAVDIRSRLGPFSLPGSILLLNKM